MHMTPPFKTFGMVAASAAMAWLYARGGPAWVLGFVLLVPWLRALDHQRDLSATLVAAWGMSVAYAAAAFYWLGSALGLYVQVGEGAGLALLLLCAPLLQPQFLAYALVRRLAGRRCGAGVRALAAAAAWVAVERFLPRLLDDTLGYGLYPSPLLRQVAVVGGGAGLTLLLLLANEGVALAWERRAAGRRAMAQPLALAAAVPVVLALTGQALVWAMPAPSGKPLRIALVQANNVDYEGQRQRKGAYGVVRELLNTHFAMSYDAVERQRAEAVLWSETAYPTTFGQPKSEAGAQFDGEILAFVNAARVPFVFGTYERDSAGEYNAAAFVQPGTGLLGFYRKTRLFPLTEYVPPWLDGAGLRRWLPWTGSWRPGNGARVFPLRLADGREIPVLPLICLDDVDSSLSIAGARLGAQAILTMSNDSWFTTAPQGARMHQLAAAFRSIETGLPQFRVTTNGYSAAIDATGAILAASRMGEPALVVADMPLRSATPTLMVRWGDWVGVAAAAFLLLLVAASVAGKWRLRPAAPPAAVFPLRVALLPPAARVSAGLLRAAARAGLFGLGVAVVLDDTLRSNTLAQLRSFTALFLAPELAAWCVLRAFAAQASLENGRLVLGRSGQRIELALSELAALTVWRLPLPTPGVSVQLQGGQYWRYGVALADPVGAAHALGAAAGRPLLAPPRARADAYSQARLAWRRWPLARYVLLPLALAIPAFHLHQHIAYGSAFGEYYSFGWRAYLSAFALWWAAWTVGVALCAALLRAAIEAATMLVVLWQPRQAASARRGMESIGQALLYFGLPAWLLLKVFGS